MLQNSARNRKRRRLENARQWVVLRIPLPQFDVPISSAIPAKTLELRDAEAKSNLVGVTLCIHINLEILSIPKYPLFQQRIFANDLDSYPEFSAPWSTFVVITWTYLDWFGSSWIFCGTRDERRRRDVRILNEDEER